MNEYNKVALYLRLSDEDEEKGSGESNSITGQRLLLERFVANHPDFMQATQLIFSDDGYTGTDFNRPGISELLRLVKLKEINCIIVKDFSRFGRNYLEVGSYIEDIFPFLDVRFISVNDNYDSIIASPGLDTAFKNLIHDIYSKDLSKKIKSIRKHKASCGEFVSAFAPYGYKKSTGDKNKLEPDEDTASTVRRIFQMASENIPKTQIARILNRENIPSPQSSNSQRKSGKNHKANHQVFWTASTVVRILSDIRYTGTAVYGKTQPKTVGSRKAVKVPDAEQITVSRAHPGIISEEIFRKVNSTKKQHNYKRNLKGPLSGKIICRECNRAPVRRCGRSGENAYYICRTRKFTSQFNCFDSKIPEKQILNAIQMLVNIFMQLDGFETLNSYEASHADKFSKKEVSILKRKLEKLNIERLNTYEKYKDRLISPERYTEIRMRLEKAHENASEELLRLKNSCDDCTQPSVNNSGPESLIFSKEIIEVFIKSIHISSNGNISIVWAFQSPFS